MPLPNREITDASYRYKFQGQEKDTETGMEAFELRLWDGRLGRWQSPDPYGEFDSPYLGMGNNPISRIDPDGGADGTPGNPFENLNLPGTTSFEHLSYGGFGNQNSTVNNIGSSLDFSWQPLTKDILINYLTPKHLGKSKDALYSTAGQLFEDAATKFLLTNTLLAGFEEGPSRSSDIIPDGYSAVQVHTNKGYALLPGHNYVEIKTKNVTLTNQIQTFINQLAVIGTNNSYPNKPVSLTFVTLYDNSIHKTVKVEVDKKLGLNGVFSKLIHIVSYYKMTNGKMRISLQEKGQSPSVHFFSNDIYLD